PSTRPPRRGTWSAGSARSRNRSARTPTRSSTSRGAHGLGHRGVDRTRDRRHRWRRGRQHRTGDHPVRAHPKRRGAAGLSLIELMIALAIGSLLILALVEVFAASRAAYMLATGLARTQENGRFAIDILQRDLRMAGHAGCVNDQARFLPAN